MGYLTDSVDIIKASYNFLMALDNVDIILNGSTNIDHLTYNLNILKTFNKLTKIDIDLLNFYLKNKNVNLCDNCNDCTVNCSKKLKLKNLLDKRNNREDGPEHYKSFMSYFNKIDKCSNCGDCIITCKKKINFPYIIWKEVFPLRI